ncbi:MAG TPA: pitrilysin family protein [Syntrophobacteria bacterium]|nr:pitrilysin family protein [Syntrophobacteria bacterium]
MEGTLLALFLGVAVIVFPTAAWSGLAERVSETVLPNGLKVLLLENHKAPVFTFQVWYRVGSRNEQWGKTGLSHMLEHMMFKGTKRFGPEEFSRIIQESGGDENAFTSTDYTAYVENLSADRVGVALDLEADRMQNLLLREEDFQTERMVVMEERRMRTDDNPQAFLQEEVNAAAFQLQPYHWPTIGWMEDIRRFTLEDLKDYYRTYYNPVNAFLVVVGDFKKEDLLPRIQAAFGSIPRGVPPRQEESIDPPQSGERRIVARREARLPYLLMGYRVPNLRDRDSYVLEVIATLLAGGKSCRFSRDLVQEKEIALGAEAEHSLLSRDPDLFLISAQPLPGKDVAAVEKALNEEIERLRREPVGARELEKAKNLLEASLISGQDSVFFQAMLLAQYEIASAWRAIDDYLPSIRNVSPEDILRVANQYLVPDRRTVGVLLPMPSTKEAPEPGFSLKSRIVR